MAGSTWSTKEDEIIRQEAFETPTAELAKRLGRSVYSLQGRFRTLGLKKRPVSPGDVFDRLTVVRTEYQDRGCGDGKRALRCYCTCECGNKHETWAHSLKQKQVTSCGCRNREAASQRMTKASTTHGMVGHPLYESYRAMMRRCYWSKDPTTVKDYQDRGIVVCDEWKEDFLTFMHWALQNGWREGLSLDRRENGLGYSPENCRWVTRPEQNGNTRNTVWVTAFGETKSAASWSQDPRCVPSYAVLTKRIRDGEDHEFALTRPMKTPRSPGA